MRKTRTAAGVLLAAGLIMTTGCQYKAFDLLDEYTSRHPEIMLGEETKVFECEACRIKDQASEEAVTSLYLDAVAEGKEKGYVPVLVFLEEVLERKINADFEEKGRESYIEEALNAERADGRELFDKYYSELEEYFGGELTVDMGKVDMLLFEYGGFGDRGLPSADWYGGELYLVKVPTSRPFEIFAWLPFCGWNECPPTDEMISMCEYWYEEYGAMPAMITYDMLYFYLDEPITDRETAVKAAKEQCAFSSESLWIAGIEDYVLMTLDSNVWVFWWD
ncbi:MAG: DUF4253 domain-containing protein [Bacteroides sp.]|nr:DUF4253 domain-containing protein [Bacteroides sp.]